MQPSHLSPPGGRDPRQIAAGAGVGGGHLNPNPRPLTPGGCQLRRPADANPDDNHDNPYCGYPWMLHPEAAPAATGPNRPLPLGNPTPTPHPTTATQSLRFVPTRETAFRASSHLPAPHCVSCVILEVSMLSIPCKSFDMFFPHALRAPVVLVLVILVIILHALGLACPLVVLLFLWSSCRIRLRPSRMPSSSSSFGVIPPSRACPPRPLARHLSSVVLVVSVALMWVLLFIRIFPFRLLGASFPTSYRHPPLPRATAHHLLARHLYLHCSLSRFLVAHPRHHSSLFPHHPSTRCLVPSSSSSSEYVLVHHHPSVLRALSSSHDRSDARNVAGCSGAVFSARGRRGLPHQIRIRASEVAATAALWGAILSVVGVVVGIIFFALGIHFASLAAKEDSRRLRIGGAVQLRCCLDCVLVPARLHSSPRELLRAETAW